MWSGYYNWLVQPQRSCVKIYIHIRIEIALLPGAPLKKIKHKKKLNNENGAYMYPSKLYVTTRSWVRFLNSVQTCTTPWPFMVSLNKRLSQALSLTSNSSGKPPPTRSGVWSTALMTWSMVFLGVSVYLWGRGWVYVCGGVYWGYLSTWEWEEWLHVTLRMMFLGGEMLMTRKLFD